VTHNGNSTVPEHPGNKTRDNLDMLGDGYSPIALIHRERHVLSEIAAGVPLALVLEELLRAVEACSRNSMMTSVLFRSIDGDHLHHGAGPSLPAAYNRAIDGIPMQEGVGSCGTAAARGTAVYVSDIAVDPLWRDYAELAVGHGLRSCWSTPIKSANGTVLGTFAVYYSEPRTPTAGDVDAISVLTQTAALAIERHRSDEQFRRSQDELRALNQELERKVTERARERSRTWLISPDLLAVIGADGQFESTNPAWESVLGWTAEEVHAHYESFVHPDDRAHSTAVFAQALSGTPVLRVENRYRHKAGGYRWLSWVAVLEDGKVYCSARDITLEKTQAHELDLRTRERDRAWGLSREMLMIARPGALLEAVNARWTEQLGWAEQELLGTSLVDYAHPDDLAATRATFTAIATAPLTVPFEGRLQHKNGSYHWFSWTGTYEEGRLYAAGRHVTAERQQAEALRQSQKMEAVGQLTGGVAHDFNNLLTVIRSSTDLLKRPDLSEERRLRYVMAISQTVDRAATLTGQLLAFARRQALTPKVFVVNESVRAISDMMCTLTGARVDVETRFAPVACLVNADPSQFDTALVNMAVNARDAMNGEGRLTISVEAVERMPALRNHPAVKGSYVAVSISDTGVGIPPGNLEHIFEPFYTTKGIGHGTGLGLSQVFGFAKQSGGEVAVASTVGKGSTFTLYLPRVTDQRQPATASVAEPETLLDGHGTCVLVVEDNPEVGNFAVQALAELGYVTVLAGDANAALAQLAEHPRRFDVVFSDVVMPGMSGIELGHEIRRLYGHLPVVLTSGYSHVLASSGSDGFELLHKPYSIEQLSRTLRTVSVAAAHRVE
jgi:PAS domain S-box-containing protein